MATRIVSTFTLLGVLAVGLNAAPTNLEISKPATLLLRKHVLAEGARPMNPARLAGGSQIRGLDSKVSSKSERLQDYYNGTDLQ